ncbi:acyltransferase family protein [Clostridium gasigenes]|uniref:Fucose 4-O-acetylase n=1 Tax=Clostridium gasigenes TaxID=94869 RepID=A0A1H0TGJ4_9CLOT|nr:acyltransferase family protein [Clostridium gasigenes]SDP52965.1 Fucose 4-O-acetylase [Clostridium gasigenes]
MVTNVEDKVDSFNNRYKWIDVLKFLGIFAIYLGHCGEVSGKLYKFVFLYHVPLFFFVSGFFALNNMNMNIREYILKKFRQLIIPYMCFALINIVSFAILENYDISDILPIIKSYALGIRNTLRMGSLWFIPCIFIVNIIYFIINKIFKNKYIICIIILMLFIATQTLLSNNPLEEPSWFMNIDSAMYYILYYALGNILFEKIKSFRFKELTLRRKGVFVVITIVMFIFTAVTYFMGISAITDFLCNKYNFFNYLYSKNIKVIHPIYLVMSALIIIYINILVAYGLRNIRLFQTIGSNTLVLCGIENVIKIYINTTIIVLGSYINQINPLTCVIYTGISIWVANYIVENIIKRYFVVLTGK